MSKCGYFKNCMISNLRFLLSVLGFYTYYFKAVYGLLHLAGLIESAYLQGFCLIANL